MTRSSQTIEREMQSTVQRNPAKSEDNQTGVHGKLRKRNRGSHYQRKTRAKNRITVLVTGKWRGCKDAVITDKQGSVPKTETERKTGWAEHINGVVKTPPRTAEADIQDSDVDLHVDIAALEMEDSMTNTRSLKK